MFQRNCGGYNQFTFRHPSSDFEQIAHCLIGIKTVERLGKLLFGSFSLPHSLSHTMLVSV